MSRGPALGLAWRMAEVFKTDQAGETAQLFIQFVMMQHQQSLYALGKHPNTPPGAPPPNPKLARVFIDQLSMIRAKTEGNLSPEEERVLDSALSELRTKYAEVTGERSE
jgi:ABC-type Fe3+ transport system substrate-binding protein